MVSHFQVPDELELIGFFGAEPIDRSVDDGYWCFEVRDATGATLRFSFNLHERSVQTALSFAGDTQTSVSHEMADRLTVNGDHLACEFSSVDLKTTLTVRLQPRLSIAWATLRTK